MAVINTGEISSPSALVLKLKNTNTVNVEGNRIYLMDDTGEYDSATNPTGYGGVYQGNAIHPSRNELALLILGINKTTAGDVVTGFEAYDTLSASFFNAIANVDGWYEFHIIGLPLYEASSVGTYVTGSYYYDYINSKAGYIAERTITSTGETGTIEIIEKYIIYIDLAALKNSDYDYGSIDTLFVAHSFKTKSLVNTQITELLFSGLLPNDRKLIRYQENYNAVRVILQGAIYEFARGNKYVAQKNIEFLNSNNYVSN